MTFRTLLACYALSFCLSLPAAMASAQGMAAWDLDRNQMGTGGGASLAGNASLNAAATGNGVGNPIGFKESTAPVTGYGPAPYDPKIEYAKGYTDVNLGRFREAEREFRNALSVQPRNPKTLFMLGEALIGQGDVKGAAGAFEKAVRYDPKQITIRTEYAVALAKTGQTDKAQAQFDVLKARADACSATCADAADLKAALDRVGTTMAAAPRRNS